MRVLADDLTGAADCATVLGVHGQDASLCLDVNTLNEASDAYSVNLGTRACGHPQAVYDITKKALLALSPPLKGEGPTPYFKVDSTWRSDSVAMALAGMDTLKPPFVLLCPAFPQEGRTIAGGVAYLHGVPLHQTPLKNDPQHPILTADVQVLLETQARALNRNIRILKGKQISITDIEDALKIVPQTPLFVVPDVQSLSDLSHLAEWVASFETPPLCMGSAGLLDALLCLSPLLEERKSFNFFDSVRERGEFQEPSVSSIPYNDPLPKEKKRESIQVISGSVNPTTTQQLNMFQTHHPEIRMLNTASWGTVTDWHERLKEAVAPLLEASNTVTILCGGDTAQAVLEQAGVNQLKWVKPLSRTCSLWQAVEDDKASRYWVLKSGNMGEADLLVQLVKELYHAFPLPSAKHL